jgi:hypothetical protein
VALGAGLPAGAGRGPAAATVLAARVGRDLDVLRCAEDGFGEGQVQRDFDVVAARRRRSACRRSPASGGVTQHRVEDAAAEEDVEEVAEPDVLEVGERPALEAVEAIAVVGGARVGVAQHLVGFGRLLEARLALVVAGIDVGMALARQLTEGLFDLLLVGVARHAEHIVVVAFHKLRSSLTRSLRGRRSGRRPTSAPRR